MSEDKMHRLEGFPPPLDATYNAFIGGRWTITIKIILAIHVLIYTLQLIWYILTKKDLFSFCFALNIGPFYLWQVLTFLFVHSIKPLQILSNMFVFCIVSGDLERQWRWRRFLGFYILCGLSGGVVGLYLYPDAIQIGSTPAILGVLAAFGFTVPQRLVFGVIRVKYCAIGLGIFLILVSSLSTAQILNFESFPKVILAYPVTIIIAWVFTILYSKLYKKVYYWKMFKEVTHIQKLEVIKERVDRILEKISKYGVDVLSWKEKRFLKNAGNHFRQEKINREKEQQEFLVHHHKDSI